MNSFYSSGLNKMAEGINFDDYIVVTYMVGVNRSVDSIIKAAGLGIEQTTGSWVDVPAETEDIREKYAAKILGVYETPDYENVTNIECDFRYYIMRIAFPAVNVEDNIPLLITSIGGNISSLPYLKIVDIEFPQSFLSKFKGPKFGIKGVRDILKVSKRPLVLNMIKPCTGYPPELGKELFYNAAAGGVDIIKDDELIAGDRVFNKLEDRVKENMDAAAKAKEVNGEETLYAVNITDEVNKLKENAVKAIKAGANCVMVNTFGIGFSALRSLAEDPDITVPIMSHICGNGMMSKSPYQGMSTDILIKLSRICGADITLVECPYGKFDISKEKYIKCTLACTGKIYDLKRTFPFYGGGVIPGLVPTILADVGYECILGVGAGIHAHPMGPEAGAKAMRQAVDAYMDNKELAAAAGENEELQAAVDKWGIYGEKDVKDNYSL